MYFGKKARNDRKNKHPLGLIGKESMHYSSKNNVLVVKWITQ